MSDRAPGDAGVSVLLEPAAAHTHSSSKGSSSAGHQNAEARSLAGLPDSTMAPPAAALPPPAVPAAASATIKWTAGKVFASLGIFILAGLAEIGGGWLVWQTIRNKKPWYYFVGGTDGVGACGGGVGGRGGGRKPRVLHARNEPTCPSTAPPRPSHDPRPASPAWRPAPRTCPRLPTRPVRPPPPHTHTLPPPQARWCWWPMASSPRCSRRGPPLRASTLCKPQPRARSHITGLLCAAARSMCAWGGAAPCPGPALRPTQWCCSFGIHSLSSIFMYRRSPPTHTQPAPIHSQRGPTATATAWLPSPLRPRCHRRSPSRPPAQVWRRLHRHVVRMGRGRGQGLPRQG